MMNWFYDVYFVHCQVRVWTCILLLVLVLEMTRLTKHKDYTNLGRLKAWKENILSMKIRANEKDIRDAKHFDSFSTVIFKCKN